MSSLKKELRHYYIENRLKIKPNDFNKKNEQLIKHLLQYILDHSFHIVFIFMAIKNEPDLSSLQKKLSKTHLIALPVIKEKNTMNFYEWNQKTVLIKKKYSILEPSNSSLNIVTPDKKTLICLPSLAIDPKGYRLGYGGGYYDRYLKNYPHIQTIGILFSEYIIKKVPSDPWDIKLTKICTETGIMSLS